MPAAATLRRPFLSFSSAVRRTRARSPVVAQRLLPPCSAGRSAGCRGGRGRKGGLGGGCCHGAVTGTGLRHSIHLYPSINLFLPLSRAWGRKASMHVRVSISQCCAAAAYQGAGRLQRRSAGKCQGGRKCGLHATGIEIFLASLLPLSLFLSLSLESRLCCRSPRLAPLWLVAGRR